MPPPCPPPPKPPKPVKWKLHASYGSFQGFTGQVRFQPTLADVYAQSTTPSFPLSKIVDHTIKTYGLDVNHPAAINDKWTIGVDPKYVEVRTPVVLDKPTDTIFDLNSVTSKLEHEHILYPYNMNLRATFNGLKPPPTNGPIGWMNFLFQQANIPIFLNIFIDIEIRNGSYEGTIDAPVPLGEGNHFLIKEWTLDLSKCIVSTYPAMLRGFPTKTGCTLYASLVALTKLVEVGTKNAFFTLDLTLLTNFAGVLGDHWRDKIWIDYHVTWTFSGAKDEFVKWLPKLEESCSSDSEDWEDLEP